MRTTFALWVMLNSCFDGGWSTCV